jgi:hypothetical protein
MTLQSPCLYLTRNKLKFPVLTSNLLRHYGTLSVQFCPTSFVSLGPGNLFPMNIEACFNLLAFV